MIQAGTKQELYILSGDKHLSVKKLTFSQYKKWYISLTLFLLMTFLFIIHPQDGTKQTSSYLASELGHVPTPLPTAIPTPTKVMEAPPQRLQIPKLSLDAEVEAVTVDEQNRMGVPVGVYNVGWYSFGVKPGEEGTALLDGHYDLTTGAPGIFYNLKTLTIGDIISIYTTTGKKLDFLIQEISTYPSDNFPYDAVITPGPEKRIALITCSGIWSYQKHDYYQRTVVSATLQNPI